MYVPRTEEMYIRLRDDFSFADGEDKEILAGSVETLRGIGVDLGAKAAFRYPSLSVTPSSFKDRMKSARRIPSPLYRNCSRPM